VRISTTDIHTTCFNKKGRFCDQS